MPFMKTLSYLFYVNKMQVDCLGLARIVVFSNNICQSIKYKY